VTVNHKLEKGNYDQCHACRRPITEEDKVSEFYQKGVSCRHCYNKHSKEQVRRYAERERQMQLAALRSEAHIGAPMKSTIERGKQEKLCFKEEQRMREKERLKS
jgi:UPF0176 protein